MALRAKVLRIKAGKFEAKKLQAYETIKERVYALEPLLQDVYVQHRPKPIDYEVRKDLVRVFNEIAKEIYGNSKETPVVVEFGSYVMDLFSITSDLDMSVNFSSNTVASSREKKIQTLRKFAKKLYAIQRTGHVSGVHPVTTAKVPILKCVDRGTGIECDISVENRDGVLKSQLIYIISSIDERFRKLSFLMKIWANAHNINSSKDRTLNSLSIILLVAFHLQTRNPRIIPPFSEILKDGYDPSMVAKSLPQFVDYGKSNRESLSELFITLLIKLSSVANLWSKGLCASACDASWTSKTWDSKIAYISVEDFTDRSQNVARAVGQAEAKQINKCIDLTLKYIFSFLDGHIEAVKLRDVLFRKEGMRTAIARGLLNLNPTVRFPCTTYQPNQSKKPLTGKKRKRGKALESVAAAEGWKQLPNMKWERPRVEGWPRTDQANMQQSETHGAGWEGTWSKSKWDWSGNQRAAINSWDTCQQPIKLVRAEGWSRTEETKKHQSMEAQSFICNGGWEGTWSQSRGGWAGNQEAATTSWGRPVQPSKGDWVGNRQAWGRPEQPSKVARVEGWSCQEQWEKHQSMGNHVGGWAGTWSPWNKGEWSGNQRATMRSWDRPSQHSQGANMEGWSRIIEQAANHQAQSGTRIGAWEGTWSQSKGEWPISQWATTRIWDRSHQSSRGDWGRTQQETVGSWG